MNGVSHTIFNVVSKEDTRILPFVINHQMEQHSLDQASINLDLVWETKQGKNC